MRNGSKKIGAESGRTRPLLVTTSWDDGHPSDLRLADLMEKHALHGTFYVPCRNSEGKPVMDAAQIASLGRRFEIGGHTQNHVDLTALTPASAAAEIRSNKARLEDLLGREICGFAYVRGRHNAVVRNLVDQAGFRYARTIKNLMSAPGGDHLQIPTTTQFFPHVTSTYIRNYVSGGPTLKRTAILAAMLGEGELAARVAKAAAVCASAGGFFHLWGHSWELDQHDLWGELDRAFARLRELGACFVSNAAWCATLAASAQAHEPRARDVRSEEPA